MSKTGFDYPANTVTVVPSSNYAAYDSACLSLSVTDRIQVIRFPIPMIDVIRQAIRASWSRALHHHGWSLTLTTGVCRGDTQVDTLVFQPSVLPPPTSFFAVSFSERDKLRLIGAPSEILSAIPQTIGANEIQSAEWIYKQIAYQFKLRGYPWTGRGDKAITSQLKLLTLLNCFSVFGWQLHASINFAICAESTEGDTWFFRRVNQCT